MVFDSLKSKRKSAEAYGGLHTLCQGPFFIPHLVFWKVLSENPVKPDIVRAER